MYYLIIALIYILKGENSISLLSNVCYFININVLSLLLKKMLI